MSNTKMMMPKLGLGTFRLKEQVVIDSVRNGLALGYRHIDTRRSMAMKLRLDKLLKKAVYRVMSCLLPRKFGWKISRLKS